MADLLKPRQDRRRAVRTTDAVRLSNPHVSSCEGGPRCHQPFLRSPPGDRRGSTRPDAGPALDLDSSGPRCIMARIAIDSHSH